VRTVTAEWLRQAALAVAKAPCGEVPLKLAVTVGQPPVVVTNARLRASHGLCAKQDHAAAASPWARRDAAYLATVSAAVGTLTRGLVPATPQRLAWLELGCWMIWTDGEW
jgi:hypothetical protein